MRSIKFTEAELEFLKGQYELELIEAEKYIGEIRNLLKKLGSISADVTKTSIPSKKKGRGRSPREASQEKVKILSEETKQSKKKAGKRGRPKKRGPKKGSKRVPLKAVKSSEPKAEIILPGVIPVEKKSVIKQDLKKVASGKAAKAKTDKTKKSGTKKAAIKKTENKKVSEAIKEQGVKETRRVKQPDRKKAIKKPVPKKTPKKPALVPEFPLAVPPAIPVTEQDQAPAVEIK
jgi:hypothetical protein